jgi:alkylhydroperoxidase/carboxymuconolactone decarboxylase family protein YurZ
MTAIRNAGRIERLKQKYGATVIDNGMRLRPDDFLDEVEWRDRIDQHYTRSWLAFTYGGLFARKGLDERTRLLVSIAQFLAMGELEEFERQIPRVVAGATPRQVRRHPQPTVYIGYIKAPGRRICVKVLEPPPDEISSTQLPGRLASERCSPRSAEMPAPVGRGTRGASASSKIR